MLARLFKKHYLMGLKSGFPSFYDDFYQYGNIETAKNCLYFIPGIDGSPGQLRYGFPALVKIFGNSLYSQALFLPEFSVKTPIWDKYTIENLEKKSEKIISDITFLSEKFEKIMIVCSSNGFYDFLRIHQKLPATVSKKLVLFWLSCAPDYFDDTRWESIFFKLNGFIHKDYRWIALPNNSWLKWINPEVSTRYKWKHFKPAKYYYKHDIESRFYLLGSTWSYFSLKCFNDCLDHLKRDVDAKINIPTYLLAGENDGYWQGKSSEDMARLANQFIVNPHIIFKPSSHLWVLMPNYIHELMELAKKHSDI